MSNELLNHIMNELRLFNKEFLVLLTLDLIKINDKSLNRILDYKHGLISRLQEDDARLTNEIDNLWAKYLNNLQNNEDPGNLVSEIRELKSEKEKLIEQILLLQEGE